MCNKSNVTQILLGNLVIDLNFMFCFFNFFFTRCEYI